MTRLANGTKLLVATLLWSSCRLADEPHGAPKEVRGASLSVVPQNPRTIADEFRDLSRQVSIFTGVYYDEVGRLTISATRETLSSEEVAAVVRWAARFTSGRVGVSATPRVQKVAYSYAALDAALAVAKPLLARHVGVNAIGIDEVTGRIAVRTSVQQGEIALRALLTSLGIPQEMLQVSYGPSPDALQLQNRHRPVVGGLQLSRGGAELACSVGLVGWKKDPNTGFGDPALGTFATTASHCASDRLNPTPGEVHGQPTIANAAAFEVAKAPIYTSGCAYPSCQLADVMVVQFYDSVPATRTLAARSTSVLPPTNPPFLGTQQVTGVGVEGALTGEYITKVGRSTGQTTGRILNSCQDTNTFQYPNLWNPCSARTNARSRPGDSGSPVWVAPSQGSATPRIAGVLFAGQASPQEMWYSPIVFVSGVFANQYQWTW